MAQDIKAAEHLYRNSRREMAVVFVVTFLALAWTVGYCWLHGYRHDPESWVVRQGIATARTAEDFHQIGGLPDWVFVGILLPWLLCSAFTVGFCLGMKDDDLGREAEGGAAHGH